MAVSPAVQIKRLKQALAEIRANKASFSDEAFSQVVMVLLEKLRRLQTIMPVETATSDEIRLVTVMFIDVKDSTEMVQSLDAGDWKAMIAAAHERIAEVVSQWDGQVGQYLGDGVLCFFGAQRSRGDDASHAVSCALQIQTVIEDYAKTVSQKYNIDFGLRIGISTGRVVVGMIGSQATKQELLALGPATNLAARIQGLAPVGAVLIDGTTYNRVRRDFLTQVLPPADLKGFDEPVNIYRVLQRRSQIASHFTETRVAGIELPLVGRDEDLALINYVFDKSLQEKLCHVVTITGDVGMGKSRLMQEAVHLADSHFLQIIMSSQYETRSKSQNLLWDMLMSQCHLSDDMPEELIRQQITAYVSELWQDPDAEKAAAAIGYLAGFEFEAPEGNLFEWVLRWFEAVAKHQPLLIAVDNLQWADEQSIGLLEQIVQRLEHTATVLIAAGQAEYRSLHPNYMRAHTRHSRISLERLSSEFTRLLIDTVFNQVERAPISLAETINQRVEGNPLFVQEYLGMLFDSGVFQSKPDGSWRYNILMLDTALNSLPNGLLGILQARLDDLSTEARQIIQLSSISGQIFWASAVQSLAGRTPIQGILNNLVMRGMISRDEDSQLPNEEQYRFSHSLYRVVAYEMIPKAKRETLHGEMAFWLLERIAQHDELYPLLAEQFQNSNQFGAALYAYLESVEVFINANRSSEALKMIDTSLGLANRLPREDALPIVSKLWAHRAEALSQVERYEEAGAAAQSALMLLKELPDDQLDSVRIKAERVSGIANMSLGRYREAYDALSRAHNLLHYKATSQIAAVLNAFGRLYLYQGRLEESYAYQKRAYDHAKTAENIELITASLVQLGLIDLERGHFADALDSFEQALAIHREKGMVLQQAKDLAYLGIVHLALLNVGKAYEYFTDASHLQQIFSYEDVLIQAYRALSLLLLQRYTQGKSLLLDAVERSSKDVHIQNQLQVIFIVGLSLLNDNVQVRELALSFLQREDTNPIHRARAKRNLAVASHQLGIGDSQSILEESLQDEKTYAGRDIWTCHWALAAILEDTREQRSQYQAAAKTIEGIVISLIGRDEMRETFLNAAYVQSILTNAGTKINLLPESSQD